MQALRREPSAWDPDLVPPGSPPDVDDLPPPRRPRTPSPGNMSHTNHGTENEDAVAGDHKDVTVTAGQAGGFESSSDESLDDNYRAFKAAEDLEVDPAEAKRVVKKIDWRVVTVLFVTYMLQYLDKSESPKESKPWFGRRTENILMPSNMHEC